MLLRAFSLLDVKHFRKAVIAYVFRRLVRQINVLSHKHHPVNDKRVVQILKVPPVPKLMPK